MVTKYFFVISIISDLNFVKGNSSFANVINRTSDAFFFTFEFANFSHVLQEIIIVFFACIYSPFTI